MNQVGLSVLVGLVAGAVGALLVQAVGGGDAGGSGTILQTTDLSAIEARLDRIEDALGGRRMLTDSPSLRGSSAARPADGSDHDLEALAARLEARLKPVVEESVQEAVKAAVAERADEALAGESVAKPKKKRMTLSEAAVELELTRDQEDAVRRITKESTDEFFKLIADKDATPEDIRREFDDAQGDPARRAGLTAKYMGKVLGNLGGVIGLGLNHKRKMTKALGSEKAERLDDGYHLTDLDPYDMESLFK